MSQPASIAIVGSGGFLIAVILGIFVAGMIGADSSKEDPWSSEDAAPDSEGMPTFADDQGIHWRQHTDGSVDWWDHSTDEWLPFEE
jgi:hypothetical protein